ncbi:hypothetical protein HN51_001591 [Arachis hypogaea]|uniref:Uncharacterized protein n=1 Tax=Arachis hypogaea TaxID=3818 RepID=A0A445ER91_ARAHY|nr:uncharacterized protein LOC112804546 [Arachis hypogaea]RYR77823.1 hypothetical protein Ahy_A01g002477 [Arachis hypogaea]
MFGRIRAASSSLDTLDGSPSKILKDDSFSIYEATLLKLKLGAKRGDVSAQAVEMDESRDDSSASSSCVEEADMTHNCNNLPSASISQHHIITEITMMDTDCSSSDIACTGNNTGQGSHNNVSILRFFKVKEPSNSSVSSCGEVVSAKEGSSGSVSSSSVELHSSSEGESDLQYSDVCEFSK